MCPSTSSHININKVSRLPAMSTRRDTKIKRVYYREVKCVLVHLASGVDYFLDGTLVKYSLPKVLISVKNLAAKCNI